MNYLDLNIDPKELIKLIKKRRSIREYIDKPVPKEILNNILEAGRWAPTGANIQPWHFVVVTDESLRKKVGLAGRFLFVGIKHLSKAPVIIVLCADMKRSKRFALFDVTLAGAQIITMATAYGLGTCWIGIFDEKKIKNLLEIPEEIKIVGLITLGYFEKDISPPPKIALEKIVHWQSWKGGIPQGVIDKITKSGPLSVFKRFVKALTIKKR
ncbi:MAG: nitroreductase [Deltaproteobacteria bacterium]|nr:MAG: nitroreductase [Deltaproteobacteria bacterium]